MQGPGRTEKFVALLGSAICAALAAVLWRRVSTWQNTLPFPALYFVELMVLGVVVAAAYLRPSPRRASTAWAAAGATTGFSILGAWTVGLFFLPAAVAFAASALITDVRNRGNFPMPMRASSPLQGAVQAAWILAMARIFIDWTRSRDRQENPMNEEDLQFEHPQVPQSGGDQLTARDRTRGCQSHRGWSGIGQRVLSRDDDIGDRRTEA